MKKQLLLLALLICILALAFVFDRKNTVSPTVQKVSEQTNELKKENCTVLPFQGPAPESSVRLDARGGISCEYAVSANNPYHFDLTFGLDNKIKGISVSKNGKKVQDLDVTVPPRDAWGGFYMDEAYEPAEEFFSLEDVNFDGYGDVKLRTYWSTKGPQHYLRYLYNPKTGMFERRLAFSFDATSYELDPATKTIKTYNYGGLAGGAWSRDTYRVIDGNLVIIKTTVQKLDPEKADFVLVRTTWELQNGIMATTSQKYFDSNDDAYPFEE